MQSGALYKNTEILRVAHMQNRRIISWPATSLGNRNASSGQKTRAPGVPPERLGLVFEAKSEGHGAG